jgi:hypothetical protein
MFRHVVMFRWNDSADDTGRQGVLDGLAQLPSRIPEIRRYEFGPDAGVSEGNFDMAVVADFDDADGYRTYAGHPAHMELVTEVIRPLIADRAAVQYEIS